MKNEMNNKGAVASVWNVAGRAAVFAVVALLALMVLPVTAHADTLDEMARKLVGVGRMAPTLEPLSLGAHALVGKDHTIALSAYDGVLTVEGARFDAHKTQLAFAEPTASRRVVFPDGSGTVALQSTATLTPAATVSFAPAASVSTYKLTPAQNETINAVTTGAVSGRAYYLVITTSGTESFTLTFGTNFKAGGTLSTGTASGKVFVLQFIFDGTNFNEVSRTSAM